MNAGPKELNEAFVRSLPDNGPVVMVNLLQFKKRLLLPGCGSYAHGIGISGDLASPNPLAGNRREAKPVMVPWPPGAVVWWGGGGFRKVLLTRAGFQ